jgi:(E)-4-hydroxy-3-methylbut-2-enyl-diphosphate synthase
VPIVADIHFHYKRAIEAAEAGAACLRINPGNIGDERGCARSSRPRRTMAAPCASASTPAAWRSTCSTNTPSPARRRWSSGAGARQDPRGQRLPRIQDQREGVGRLPDRRRLHALAEACDHPLHLGVTEAGGLSPARSRAPSASATCSGWDRRHHARVALRRSGRGGEGRLRDPEIAQPAPSRRDDHLLPVLRPAGLRRDQDRGELEERLAHIKTPMSLSIIGCVVNGPGEALMTDIGFTGGGAGSRHGLSGGQAEPQDGQ